MRLCECYIENFGVLKNFHCKFPEGLCSLVRENGAGKTTLTVFIKAMFYGLDDTRKIKLAENDRKHYLPWDNSVCRGSLTFLTENKKYKIERTFANKAADDLFALYDLETGLSSDDFSERIGEEIFGIDADGFERTLFLSENNLSGKNENKSIAAKLSDLTDTDSDIGGLDEALAILEADRKFYHKKGGSGEIYDLRDSISEYAGKINDIQRKKEERDSLLLQREQIGKRLNAAKAEKRKYDRENELFSEREIQRNNEKIYLDKLEILNKEKEKAEEIGRFFKNHTPTNRELQDIVVASAEYERIADSLKNKIGFDLRNESVGQDEINHYKAVAKEIEQLSHSIKAKEDSIAVQRENAKRFFPSEAPEEKQIKKQIELISAQAKNGARKNALLIIALCLLVLGGALYLVKPILAVSAALSLPFFIMFFVSKNSEGEEIKAFISKYLIGSADRKNPLHSLFEIKSNLDLYNSMMTGISNQEKEFYELKTKEKELAGEIEEFLDSQNTDAKKSFSDRLSELELDIVKRQVTMGVYEKEYLEQKSRYESLNEEITKFISLFPVSSRENALAEIKERLYDYDSIKEAIRRDTDDIEYFISEKRIDISRVLSPDYTAEIGQKFDTGSINEQILALGNEFALLTRKIEEYDEKIEKEDEYRAHIEELKRKETLAVSTYNTIEKTKEFLKLGGQNLTTKYLKKTKEAFLDYVKLITREDENLEIDTSFSVKKTEGALTKDSEAYSKGTRDLYAIAMRFALVDSLYEKETPFIILDDPFAYFDDEKLARALSIIKAMSKKRQIIYLSCTKARSI